MEEMRRETTQMRAEVVQMRAEVVPLRDEPGEGAGRASGGGKIGDGRVGGCVDWRRRARRRRRRRRPPRRRRRPPRRPGVREWKRGVSRRPENARANRAECREVRGRRRSRLTCRNASIELEEKLRDARKSLEDARATAAASDVEPQMRKMEATSRRLRREMAAAERVRFAAKLPADDAESRRAAAATDGDEDALAELNARRDVVGERRDFDAMAELAGRVASMQTEMAAMRSSFTGDVDASRRREGGENAAAPGFRRRGDGGGDAPPALGGGERARRRVGGLARSGADGIRAVREHGSDWRGGGRR